MPTDTFDFFSNVFGFIVAVVSLAAFIIKVFLYHRRRKIKKLELLIDQTDTVLQETMEDGLLTHPLVKLTETKLQHRVSNDPLYQDCLEWRMGTSASIRDACQSVEELRARLMRLSQERRMEANTPLAYPPPALLHNPPVEHESWPIASPMSRPSSFSVKLGERGLSCVQQPRKGLVKSLWRTPPRSVCTNPLCDPAQSDTDVREGDTQFCIASSHTSVTADDGA